MHVITQKLNQVNKSQSNTIVGGSSDVADNQANHGYSINVGPFVENSKNGKMSVQSDIQIIKS